jgi:hypothetical protein
LDNAVIAARPGITDLDVGCLLAAALVALDKRVTTDPAPDAVAPAVRGG